MFDIGFWELALIGVVALLVVGPERLPGLARNVGRWVARIRRYVSAVRDDIEREIRAEELKDLMDKSKRSNPLADVGEETTGAIGALRKQLEGAERDSGGGSRASTSRGTGEEAKKATDKESDAKGSMSAQAKAAVSATAASPGEEDTAQAGAAPDPGEAANTVGKAFVSDGDLEANEERRVAPATPVKPAGEDEGAASERGDGGESHERRSG